MSQQQLFVPAAPGWYVRPGDPPDVTRRWDGRQWLCEIKGPIRDHFDYLRAKSMQGLSPEEQDVLRRLTHDVSAIEDLVLPSPTANPPLVQIAAPPPYAPPPVDPYTSVPISQGNPAWTGPQAGGQRPPRGRAGRVIGRVALTLVLIPLVAIFKVFVYDQIGKATGTSLTSLTVGSCITLAYPPRATGPEDVTWSKGDCATASGGPVSYTVIAKLDPSSRCDADAQYVQSYGTGKKATATYCLMENLKAGECLYEDEKGFYFDVACTDSRAMIKITQRADQGTGVACGGGADSWEFPAGNRTYCFTKV